LASGPCLCPSQHRRTESTHEKCSDP